MGAKVRPSESTMRDLYEGQRLTTRAIGTQFGVSHTAVKRWLHFYSIPTRDPHNGLLNRGSTIPTPEQLICWLHVEHLSYRAIGTMLGIDMAAVRYWARKYGIRSPTVWETRRKGVMPTLPDADTLRALYDSGESLTAIAIQHGVSEGVIRRLCREYAITPRESGWGQRRITCTDGHRVRSTYELRVDEWLTAHGITHTYEPVLPFDRRCHADFWAHGWYIEIWGVREAKYEVRKRRKLRLYEAHGLPLIQLADHMFDHHRHALWERRLRTVMAEPVWQSPLLGLPALPPPQG